MRRLFVKDSRETRIDLSAVARKAAETLAKMPGSKIIKHAQAHKHVTASSAILHSWNDRTGKQEIGLTLNLLNMVNGSSE